MKGSILELLRGKIAELMKKYGLPDNLFSRFFGAYFLVSVFQIASAKKQDIGPISNWQYFIAEYPLFVKILWVMIVFLWLSILYRFAAKRFPATDHIALTAGVVMFALWLVWRSGSFYLGVAAAAVAVVLSVYALGKIDQSGFEKLGDIPAGVIVFGLSAAVAVFIAVTTIANHLNFGTSCFDMGIFIQMFHSMRENLTAVTTCERDMMLSHFRVHASFIFYLFLPIYYIFPSAETLLAGQAVFAMAGVVPLFLIAKKHGFKGFSLVSMCLIYVFCGGLVMPCYYAFHENAFLPTILMWLLYAADRKNIPLFYMMSLLTCIVKEDAPLYVICIALFLFFEEKGRGRLHGLIAAALSGGYFVAITRWLTENGDGQTMTSSRLGSLMTDPDSGFVGIIRNVLSNPGYFVSRFIQEDTLFFFVQTMLPLLFLPFFTKKIHRFLLMIPYVIMNLVIGAGYGYAANIGFQYIFGPVCLLIYMTLRNVEELPTKHRNTLLTAAAIVTTVTTVSMASGKISILESRRDLKEYYQSAEACIASVPEDASVLANTFLLPHCAQRSEVYELDNGCYITDASGNCVAMIGLDRYDFCVFSKKDPVTAQLRPFLEMAGWEVYAESDGDFIVVFVSPEYLATN